MASRSTRSTLLPKRSSRKNLRSIYVSKERPPSSNSMRISISLSSRSARNLRFLELRSFAPDGAHAPDSKTLRVFSSSGRCPSHPSAHRIPERRFAPGKRSEDPNPPDAQAPDPFTVFRQRTEDAVSRKHVLYSCYPLIRITLFPGVAGRRVVPAGATTGRAAGGRGVQRRRRDPR